MWWKQANDAVNLIAFWVIVLGVFLDFMHPGGTLANTLVSGGLGAITGAAAANKHEPGTQVPN